MSVKFVHAADLHLDAPFVGLREVGDIGERLRDATLQAFDRVVELCLQEHVDFAVFAGDLFDGEHRSLRAQVRFTRGLGRLAEAGISAFIAHGNHDPWESWSPRLDWPSPELIHRFPPGEVSSFSVERGGEVVCQVYGTSFRGREETRNLAKLYSRTDDAPHAVGVLHTDVGAPQSVSTHAPCSLQDLRDVPFDYWALGHIHTREVLHESEPCVVYPGNTQGLNPNETGPRGCYVVTLEEGQPPTLDFRATSVAEWQRAEVSIEGSSTEEDLVSAAEEAIDGLRGESTAELLLVRLALIGAGPLSPGGFSELLAAVRDVAASGSPEVWVESVRDETRPEVDLEARARGDDFLGEFLRLAEDAKSDDAFLAELLDELEPIVSRKEARGALPPLTSEGLREWIDAAKLLGAERLAGEGDEA